jgi:hypothetical protein
VSDNKLVRVLFGWGVLQTIKCFFRFEPKHNETQSVSVVFRFVSRNQKIFFSVCFGVSDWYRNNQNKQNIVETNRKNLHKTFSIRGPSKPKIFFLGSNQNKPKLNLFWLFFGLLYRDQPTNFFSVSFSLFRCLGPVSKQPKQTELMIWGIKKFDILTNLLLFRLVFCLFWLFRNTETPCFNIKAKQLKQKSFFV